MRPQAEWKVITHALLHLGRGAVGEGDREDLGGRCQPLVDQVRDAMGEHARLARSGTGHHQQRSLRVQHRLTLLGVEGVE
jgi:hypothetical protein